MDAEYFKAFLTVVFVDLQAVELEGLVGIEVRLVDLTALLLDTGQLKIIMRQILAQANPSIIILLGAIKLARKHHDIPLILNPPQHLRTIPIINNSLILILRKLTPPLL